MWYPLNSPLNHKKKSSKVELLTKDSVFETVLLVNVY